MHNLLDPAILFFVFGVFAGAIKSNLEVPSEISKFLSLYLLMALGLKGGFALAQSGLSVDIALSLLAAVLMALIVPAVGYKLLKRLVSPLNAAAIAAAYGSVSAVTFVTATQFLESNQISYGGHMAVAMVLMESPAIIMAVLLASLHRRTEAATTSAGAAGVVAHPSGAAAMGNFGGDPRQSPLGPVLHEAFTNGAHLLLLGAMVIGYLGGEAGQAVMAPFSSDLFKGMLAFFLLDMGLKVARNVGSVRGHSPLLIAYAVMGPVVHATLALGVAHLLQLPLGDAVLLMVLSASASYIVVPAVLRHAIPEANPSLYFGLAMGVSFPLNILFGIPLYALAASWVLG